MKKATVAPDLISSGGDGSNAITTGKTNDTLPLFKQRLFKIALREIGEAKEKDFRLGDGDLLQYANGRYSPYAMDIGKLIDFGVLFFETGMDEPLEAICSELSVFPVRAINSWIDMNNILRIGGAAFLKMHLDSGASKNPLVSNRTLLNEEKKQRAAAVTALTKACTAFEALPKHDKWKVSDLFFERMRGQLRETGSSETNAPDTPIKGGEDVGRPSDRFSCQQLHPQELLTLLSRAVTEACTKPDIGSRPRVPAGVGQGVEYLGCLWFALTGTSPKRTGKRGGFKHFLDVFHPRLVPEATPSQRATALEEYLNRLRLGFGWPFRPPSEWLDEASVNPPKQD